MGLFVNSLFGVISLPSGTRLLAVFYVMATILAYFLTEIILEDFANIENTVVFRATINPMTKSLTCSFFLIASFGLLFGSHMKIRLFFLPYMLSIQAIILGSLSLGIALFHKEQGDEGLKRSGSPVQKMAGIFFLSIGVLNIYFFLVILSHYVDLGETRKFRLLYKKPNNKVDNCNDLPSSPPGEYQNKGRIGGNPFSSPSLSPPYDVETQSVIYLN